MNWLNWHWFCSLVYDENMSTRTYRHTGAALWTWAPPLLLLTLQRGPPGFLSPFPGVRVMRCINGEEGPAVRFGREPEFADAFYKSWPWRKCRDSYLDSVGRLCERCAKKGSVVPADQVHHKIKLTPENLNDPNITLNWDNLEALCFDCHQDEHKPKRWRCDPDGHIRL